MVSLLTHMWVNLPQLVQVTTYVFSCWVLFMLCTAIITHMPGTALASVNYRFEFKFEMTGLRDGVLVYQHWLSASLVIMWPHDMEMLTCITFPLCGETTISKQWIPLTNNYRDTSFEMSTWKIRLVSYDQFRFEFDYPNLLNQEMNARSFS